MSEFNPMILVAPIVAIIIGIIVWREMRIIDQRSRRQEEDA